MECYATDILPEAEHFLEKTVKFKQNDIGKEILPFDDNYFDAIYTKSLIEHIDNYSFFLANAKEY